MADMCLFPFGGALQDGIEPGHAFAINGRSLRQNCTCGLSARVLLYRYARALERAGPPSENLAIRSRVVAPSGAEEAMP
jgi:hypothetical protein